MTHTKAKLYARTNPFQTDKESKMIKAVTFAGAGFLAFAACTPPPSCGVTPQGLIEAAGMVVDREAIPYDKVTTSLDLPAASTQLLVQNCPAPETPPHESPTTPPTPPQPPEPPCIDCNPTEPRAGQNPGNGKPVGNSPFDGITGNSGRNDAYRGSNPASTMNGQRDDAPYAQPSGGNGASNANK